MTTFVITVTDSRFDDEGLTTEEKVSLIRTLLEERVYDFPGTTTVIAVPEPNPASVDRVLVTPEVV